MSDEPVFTGWVQAQFSGDIDRAKGFMHEARRVLGGLLSAHGINDKVEAGEPSGFVKTYRQYPDGTRITAVHNNGHNTIRVDTPTPKQSGSTFDVGVPTGESWEGKPTSGTSHSHSHVSHVDVPHLKTSRPEDEEEEEKKKNGPYMWVGIRNITANKRFDIAEGCIIEPHVDGKPRGILNSTMDWGTSRLYMNSDGSMDTKYGNSNFADAISDDFNSYANAQFNNYPGLEYGMHCTTVFVANDSNSEHGFLASANGMICQPNNGAFLDLKQGSPNNVYESGQEDFLLYDPLSKDQNGKDRPDVGERKIPGDLLAGDPPLPYSDVFPTPPLRNWDVVWEVDPDPYSFPGDTRKWKTDAIDALEKNYGMAKGEDKVLPGLYMLVVHAYGFRRHLTSSRAGKPIPGSNFDPKDPLGQRSSASDYANYMYEDGGTGGASFQIEVRLGKGSDMNIFKFETSISTADGRTYVTSPFGDGFKYDSCAGEGGPNPMGPNFMEQPIAIDVQNGVADWADKFDGATVEPIYGGGTYGSPDDDRKPLLLCVYGGYFASQPGDEAWAEYAGYAAFKALEDATSGMYGHMLFSEFSEGALAGIFAGGDRTKVNILDCTSGELSVAPLINGPHDYDPAFITNPDGTTTNSPYLPYFQWFYPYRVLIKAQCKNSLGILVTASKDGWSLQTGQTRGGDWGSYPGDPDPPDCCT